MGSDLGLKASKILAPNLQNLGRNFGLSTWLSIKETIATSASYAMSTTQNLAQSHPYIAGIFSISSIGYMGYRFLMNHLDAKSLLQLRKSEMKIAEENARIAHDLAIKNAQIIHKIMLRNAKIRNTVIIALTTSTISIGVIYTSYHLCRSIQKHNFKKTRERELFTAKQTLLNALMENAHNTIGIYGLPEGCGLAASNLLTLPDGAQALRVLVKAFHYQEGGAAFIR